MSDQLFPTPETLTLSNGTEVIINKTKVKHIPAVTKFIAAIISDLASTPGATLGVEFMDTSNAGSILQLIANHAEELPKYVAMHCSLTEAEIQELDSDDYVILIAQIVAYNKRFFSDRVAAVLAPNAA